MSIKSLVRAHYLCDMDLISARERCHYRRIAGSGRLLYQKEERTVTAFSLLLLPPAPWAARPPPSGGVGVLANELAYSTALPSPP